MNEKLYEEIIYGLLILPEVSGQLGVTFFESQILTKQKQNFENGEKFISTENDVIIIIESDQ